MYRLLLIIVVFLFSATQSAISQTKQADDYLKAGNYVDALNLLLKSYKNNQDDMEMAHNIAICYLNTNINKRAALTYIEKVYELSNGKPDADVVYEYALALTYHYKFKEAKKIFQQYKGLGVKGKYGDKIDRNLSNCDAALTLMKKPLNITYKNLGDKVNTEYPDYYPFVSKNDSILYFTSRRRGNMGGSKEFDGYYPSDIFYFLLNKELFKAKNIGKMLNTIGDDQVVGLSNDGTDLFIYFDMIDHYGDIYIAENKKGNFSRNFKLDNTVNSKNLETSASISADGNTLFFTSDRPGGYGGLDLYMSRKLPDGNWGIPQNLGSDVNTPFNEDFPQLSNDGNTLYFSTEGRPGMGGYDIFQSQWNKEKNEWSTPINIGYPLNTPSDNMTISFSVNETFAYISDLREDSKGDLDIYQVEFHDKKASKAVFIYSPDKKINDNTAELIVSDSNREIIGIYRPDSKGKFIVILDSGSYLIEIENENGVLHTENLSVNSSHILQVSNKKTFSIP